MDGAIGPRGGDWLHIFRPSRPHCVRRSRAVAPVSQLWLRRWAVDEHGFGAKRKHERDLLEQSVAVLIRQPLWCRHVRVDRSARVTGCIAVRAMRSGIAGAVWPERTLWHRGALSSHAAGTLSAMDDSDPGQHPTAVDAA